MCIRDRINIRARPLSLSVQFPASNPSANAFSLISIVLGGTVLRMTSTHCCSSKPRYSAATPSSTTLVAFADVYKRQEDIYAEWAPNEKVALEVAHGACTGGARSFCAMKHVGLNVAADPLYTASYIGVNGGMVIAVADDPGMHLSLIHISPTGSI